MDITINANVTAVTVYPDRARVVLTGSSQLKPGTHKLLVGDLPISLERASLRAAGMGTAKVQINGVDVVERFYRETPAERVRTLEKEIEQLEDELRVLEDEKSGWQAHAKYVDGLRTATNEYAKGLSRGKTTVAEQAALVAFIREQDAEMRTAVRQLEQKQRELTKTLTQRREELKQIASARPRRRFEAQVEVLVQEGGAFSLEISYVVGQAGWRPLYDVRLLSDENGRSLELTMIAEITQNTGQPWEQVALAVSTAQPALNQRLPKLTPWYIDQYRPPVPRRAKMAKTAAMPPADAEPEMVAMAAPAPVPAEMLMAETENSETAVRFKVQTAVDIPSDGEPHKTTLSRLVLSPKLDYITIPRHTDAVFRRATVTNSGSAPLLGGQANLFVDNEFIGKTHIEHTARGEELELLLGVEERITVERELVKRDVDKRLLRDNRQLKVGYAIKLKNLLPQTIDVVVEDQLPVSRHEQIRVKLDFVKPEPAEKSDLNMLEWHLSLAPDQEGQIEFSYQVEHPRDMQVTGLMD